MSHIITSHITTSHITTLSRIITLTTDFGQRDAYVAAMKGVILGINPSVQLVDVSHDIAAQDVMEGAFVLRGAVEHFPPGTIHVAVVDPGVGTARRPVALRRGYQYFVGPDNGLFALLLDRADPDEAVVLDRPDAWRTPAPSATFHGRDVFAPVAAHLSTGRPLSDLGSPLDRLTPLHWALPIADEQGLQGWVVHLDHFGNCITNIPRADFDARRAGRRVKCIARGAVLDTLAETYADVEAGEPLLLFNSDGFLEIAVNAGNAAELLGIRKGDTVHVVFRGHS